LTKSEYRFVIDQLSEGIDSREVIDMKKSINEPLLD
jgi:hypothetical protein